jgi:hypothetical protein
MNDEFCEECGAISKEDNPVVLTINGFLCLQCEQGEIYGEHPRQIY